MKTVAGSLRAVDDNFRWAEDVPVRDLGRVHADACVGFVLGLPKSIPPAAAARPDLFPALSLTGRNDEWIRIERREGGSELLVFGTGEEAGVRMPELQAVYRVRSFIEHWGEETELTSEIRLPPEAREIIADRERIEDETRHRRMKDAPARVVFVKRPFLLAAICTLVVAFLYGIAYGGALIFADSLPPLVQIGGAAILLFGLLLSPWLFFKKYEVVVDRSHGEIREHLIGRERAVARLDAVRHADVLGLDRGGAKDQRCRVLLVLRDDNEIEIAHGGWPTRTAAFIADAVNDAVDLPAARRKLLRYRREMAGGAGR